MKHFLVLAAFIAFSAASAFPKDETPVQCLVEWDQDGQCMTGQQTWTYDFSIGTCRAIDMYGCVGSDNVFTTEEECLSVCAKAEKKGTSDLKFTESTINEYMDELFGELSSKMKNAGGDPMEVDGFVIDQIPNLKLEYKHGSLSGLSNFVRVGDWKLFSDSDTRKGIYGKVAVQDVKGEFAVTGELEGKSEKVTVRTITNEIEAYLDLDIFLNKCSIRLTKISLDDCVGVTLDIEDNSSLLPLYDDITSYSKHVLLTEFVQYAKQATELVAETVDVCALFNYDNSED